MPFRQVPQRLLMQVVFLAAALMSAGAAALGDEFVELDKLVICFPEMPSEAEFLAVQHFQRSLKRMTGRVLPVSSERPEQARTQLVIGSQASLGGLFEEAGWQVETTEPDRLNQSYAVALVPPRADQPRRLVAASFGKAANARASLGLGYALGELLRQLEIRNGAWGFAVTSKPKISSPAMPNRTLYLMNSSHTNPGLSLEFMSEDELHAYADFLIDARYSRVSFWQWSSFYLFPDNDHGRDPTSLGAWQVKSSDSQESPRARNERVHRTMRSFFDYARRRGLEVYHQLSPMHVNVDLLPDDPKYVATGYYGSTSTCWSQPEARALARKMAQAEMEYFGPVDGYIVWFYDPGGCFCDKCYPRQAENLFEQFSMVEELANGISPGAKFQAVLWPTWCFHEYNDRGIPYKSESEVQAFVRSFLQKLLRSHQRREISIMDTCEQENSNIYNGLVKPDEFKRTAFMYTIMGLPSESAFPFTAFRIGDLVDTMGKARDRQLDDGVFFIQYARTNMPSVFAFADVLYERRTTSEQTAPRYAASIAKGGAAAALTNLLLELESLKKASSYDEKEAALGKAQLAGDKLQSESLFFGDRDWLRGQLIAQKHYLGMARAKSEADFQTHYSALHDILGQNAMYRHFAEHTLQPELVGRQIKTFWREPIHDSSRIGLLENK